MGVIKEIFQYNSHGGEHISIKRATAAKGGREITIAIHS